MRSGCLNDLLGALAKGITMTCAKDGGTAAMMRKLIHPSLLEDSLTEHRSILLAGCAIAFLLLSGLFTIVMPFVDGRVTYSLVSMYFAMGLLIVILYRLRNATGGHEGFQFTSGLFVFWFNNIIVTECVLTGDGTQSTIFIYMLFIPMFGFYLLGERLGLRILILVLVESAALHVLGLLHPYGPLVPVTKLAYGNQTIIGVSIGKFAVLITVGNVSYLFERTRSTAICKLEATVRDLEHANKRLSQAAQDKARFLANMSHELRTPLHGIIAMSADLMSKVTGLASKQNLAPPWSAQSDAESTLEAVSIISDSADHLLSLVNDLLDFERMEANHLELETTHLSIPHEVRKVINVVSVVAERRGVTIEPPDIQLAVAHHIGDPLRIRQVLFNLLSNAIKFIPSTPGNDKGKGRVKITVRSLTDTDSGGGNATIQKDKVYFEVEDNGIGIGSEQLERLFKSFSQVDTSTARRYGGSGLGLAISKRLVEMMGGEIGCRSAVGQGSVFWFYVMLPPVRAVDTPQSTPECDAAMNDDSLAPGEAATMSRLTENVSQTSTAASSQRFDGQRTILLVEDNPINVKVALRLLSPWPHTPIIALTASATAEYKQLCLQEGMDAFTAKPLRKETLIRELERWMNHQ